MNSLRRITLIRPNMADFRATDAMPPLSMAILAARTPAGVEVRFYDDKIEPIPADDSPDLVAITVETFTARRAYEIAEKYRERGATVVMGGYHPTLLPQEVLIHADAIVIGDAEGSWERLLRDFQRGQLQRVYRGGNNLPLERYVLDRGIFADKRYPPVMPLQFGRGCRFSCDFCSIRAFYAEGYRQRPAEEVAREIREIGSNKFHVFVDDNLYNCPASFRQLLAQLATLDIRWGCQISIDVAKDDNILDEMAAAGCKVALVGFESMDEHNLRQMGKRWNNVAGSYRDVAHRMHQRGIALYGTFVFGYDHDDEKSLQDMVAFAKDSRLEIANFNPLMPTPGTPLYQRLKDEGRLLYDNWWLDPHYRYGEPIFEPALISAGELSEAIFAAKEEFYSWPSMITRIFRSHAHLDWRQASVLGLVNIISRREVLRKQHMPLGR